MKKKIITLILVGVISTTALISCGNNKKDTNTNPTTSQTQVENDTTAKDAQPVPEPAIPGDVQTPTVEVQKVVNISDLKEKDADEIKKILGEPKNIDGTKYSYEKDGYTFDINYIDSKSGIIKITPLKSMRYPNDGINILNVLGIAAGTPDVTAPIGLIWNNKFDTYKITVASDVEVENKLTYVEIILSENYAQ